MGNFAEKCNWNQGRESLNYLWNLVDFTLRVNFVGQVFHHTFIECLIIRLRFFQKILSKNFKKLRISENFYENYLFFRFDLPIPDPARPKITTDAKIIRLNFFPIVSLNSICQKILEKSTKTQYFHIFFSFFSCSEPIARLQFQIPFFLSR